VVGEYYGRGGWSYSKTVRFRSKVYAQYFWKTKIQGGCVGMVDYTVSSRSE